MDPTHKAIDIARLLLLQYHPDVSKGRNYVLALMFDMNLLWEKYVFSLIKRASKGKSYISVKAQQKALFWHNTKSGNLGLRPDIVIASEHEDKIRNQAIVLDTKWKYDKETSIEDVRQMFAYGNYFSSQQNYLVYPGNIENEGKEKVKINSGHFFIPKTSEVDKNQSCGLMFIDPFTDKGPEKRLNKEVGGEILEVLKIELHK
jgi:5-methylcytosine-specific restriction enzyme subunit McrC